MKWTLLVAIGFVACGLGGCYSDQKQQLALCQIEDNKVAASDPTDPPGASLLLSTSRISLCMEAHGYQETPTGGAECGVDLQAKGNDLVDHAYGRAISARCYEPMGWWDRHVLALERALGEAS